MHPTRYSARRRAKRGFTLMEMMVVILLLGLLSGATAVAVFHHLAIGREKATRIAARNLRSAASTWRAEHPECPTGKQLRDAKFVDRGAMIDDAWGTPFAVLCEPEDITVVSFGPDRLENTADDLREPPPT